MQCSNCSAPDAWFVWWESPYTGEKSRQPVQGWIKKYNCSQCLETGHILAEHGDVP